MFVDPELDLIKAMEIKLSPPVNQTLPSGFYIWEEKDRPGTFFFPRKLDIFWALGCGVIEKSGDCWVWRLMFTEEGVISVEGGPVVD